MNSFVFFPYAALKVCNPNGKRNPTTMIKCKDHQTTLNTINYVQYQFWFRHPHNLLIVCIIHTTYSYIHNKVHLTQLLLFYDFCIICFYMNIVNVSKYMETTDYYSFSRGNYYAWPEDVIEN